MVFVTGASTVSRVQFGDKPCQWCKYVEGTGAEKNTRCGMDGGFISLEEYLHGRGNCPNWKMPGKKRK
jgi:hypothetical protein